MQLEQCIRLYKTFDPKYTNPQYEDKDRCKNNERVCKSLIKKILCLTLQDLMKQAEAIANIATNINLDYMSPSYKPMPNEKLVYQWKPGKLYKTCKEVQKRRK